MPYSDISQLPNHVQKYPDKVKRMWMHTFNSVYEKVLRDTGDKKQAEENAFKAANAVIKKRIEKFGSNRYGYNCSMHCAIDKFIGVL